VRSLSAHDLLEVREVGQDQHPLDRALTLLGAACPELAWEELVGLSVGARDARLLTLRERTFGPRLAGFVECPRCAEGLEFEAAVSDLRAPPASGGESWELMIRDLSLRFRLPDSRDLGAAAASPDPGVARRLLVRRCVLHASRGGAPVASDDLPPEAIAALALQMVERDPQAETLLEFSCPACEHDWQALFDIVAFFWSELAARADHLLGEVHALARAYGWREADILGMSAHRRRFYLEMVT
jgi:hypothetical protein